MMSRIAVALGVLSFCSSVTAATPDDMNDSRARVATDTSAVAMDSWQPCESCEWAVRSVQDFVADPHHQEQLAKAVDSVACTFVPDDFKDECDTKVAAAVKHTVRLFEDYISPASVCKPICPDSATLAEAHMSRFGRYPQCSHCEYVATELASSHIGACAKLPAAFYEDCSNFVKMNGKSLQLSIASNGKESACIGSGHCEVPLMREALSAAAVPDSIRMTAANVASIFGASQANSVLLQNKETCEFCRLAVMEVRDKISDPEFQKEVEKYAKSVCESLGDYKTMCTQYVDEYAPIAFALAEDYLDPRTVCGVLHMCPSHSASEEE